MGREQVEQDPFSPEIAPGVSLIVQMRIYDVLMALLEHSAPDMAETLDRIHAAGGIVGAMPYIDVSGEPDHTPPNNVTDE